MEAVYKLGAVASLKDLITSPFKKMTQSGDKFKSKLKEIDGAIEQFERNKKKMKTGGIMLGVGTGMAFMAKGMLEANRGTSRLQANLRSLNLGEDAIHAVTASAVRASSIFDVTRDEFLDASYDIKSGIETINNAEIGKFTETVAKTAAATKGSTKQLASLFGTVYNQNKKFYKNLSDSDFGELIGNSLSFAVQKYKTEGPKLQQAIESVSGAAAVAGYDMAEQINILGALQNVMPSGEAGTGFRAFIDKATEASQKLGLSFHNQAGQLLSVADILDKLRGKFGDTLTAFEKVEIKKAFGSDEAKKLIDNLWYKTGKLRTNIEALRNAKGSEFLDQMADANLANLDTQIANVGKSWDNFKSILGSGVGWALKPLFTTLNSGLQLINEFAINHPTLVKVFGTVFTGITTFLVFGGAITLVKGAFGIMRLAAMANISSFKSMYTVLLKLSRPLKFVGSGVSMLGRKFMTTLLPSITSVIPAVWSFTVALLANPITWIILGIVALGAAIYGLVKYWDDITAAVSEAWEAFGNYNEHTKTMKTGLETTWGGLKNSAGGLKDVLVGVFTLDSAKIISGFKRIGTGIKDIAIGLKDTLKGAVNFLGEKLLGPELWKKSKDAGRKFITTMWEGIKSAGKWLKDKISDLFKSVRNLFPSSDAKEGPFSTLTRSGRSLLTTFNSGIEQEAKKTPAVTPYMKKTMGVLQGDQKVPVAGQSGSGFVLNIESLIGTLNLEGKQSQGDLDYLSDRIVEILKDELTRYGYA